MRIDEEAVRAAILARVKNPGGEAFDELVEGVAYSTGATKHLVVRNVYALRSLGKVFLRDPAPPSTFLEYVTSGYALAFWGAAAAVLLILAAVYLLPQGPPALYFRYVLGVVFVLYMPGHALITALYPKADDLNDVENLALSIGLSLAVVPLIGLMLSYTPWGARLESTIFSLSVFTIALSLAATSRRTTFLKLETHANRMPRQPEGGEGLRSHSTS